MLPAMRPTRTRFLTATLCLPLALSACNKDKGSTAGSGDVSTNPGDAAGTQEITWAVPTSETELGKTVVAAVDPTTDPCVDFYQYACGGWIEATELPADKPRYGRGFGELTDRNDDVLKGIVEGLASQEGE